MANTTAELPRRGLSRRPLVSALPFLLSLAALALLAPGRLAQASDAKEPYKLRVVLHVAKHPLLTEVFRRQVSRELRDGLLAALGDLAKVEVVDKHPRLGKVLDQGLGKGLDDWGERSEFKTHFVLVDSVGTSYRVRARQ